MTQEPVPIADTPGALTPGWLTAALDHGDHLAGAVVTDVSIRPLGTGQMSDAFRLSLTYDRAVDAPSSLIAKLPATDETSRATAKALRSYEKEVRFYQELAPGSAVRVPTARHAAIDPETARFVLLLDDLSPAEQGDQLAGCTPEVAAAAVAELIPLHAPHWGDESIVEIDWLVGDVDAAKTMGLAVLPLLWQGFQDRYGADLAPVVRQAGAWLFSHLDAYLDVGDSPLTVVHGDYRLDNLLIAPGPEAEVVGIVDWQTCTRGPALRDVAYVLGAGLSETDRRTHEEALVRGYHGDLVAAGVSDYGWEACWEEYRRGTWAGVVMAVGASMMVERTDRGDEMFLAMAHRHAQHARDLDADELFGP